jgi:toxin ParE1/3/4
MRVSFAPGAWAEVEEAQRFYATISPLLADDFTAAFDQAVKRVVQEPLMWPPLTKRIRRCLFDRFPYGLIYRVEGDAITILTVMHERRRPGYWRGR